MEFTAPTNLKGLLSRDHSLKGGLLFGLEGHLIDVQARALQVYNRPVSWRESVSISGIAKGAITEVLNRISGAFSKLQVPNPQVEILINLAPADIPKEGTWLDLPIAIIMLQAAGLLPDLPEEVEQSMITMGEIGIHAEIRPVPGALSLAYRLVPGQKLLVPAGNDKECALILAKPGHEGCKVFTVNKLEEVINFFRGKHDLKDVRQVNQGIRFEAAIPKATDFGKIKGQEKAKRAAIISAAGGHNLLLIGPPGEGKSLLAGAIPGILPKLNDAEKVELTRIYSACGMLPNGTAVTRRPMRSIHHSASLQALIGGGSGVPRPGEVTLAHLGILFLDEIAEFSRGTLEALRQPIENGNVTLNRVKASLTFPCKFTLVAAMNPCPCGHFGTDDCKCSPSGVKAYQQKLSGPLLDRIDLQVEIKRLSLDERFAPTEEGVSDKVRREVQKAHSRQSERYKDKGIPFNAAIPGGAVADFANFSAEGFSAYKEQIGTNSLSTRSVDRLAKVARTIADLDNSDQIGAAHVDEAASFVIGGMLRNSIA